jgi:hypothetical protein
MCYLCLGIVRLFNVAFPFEAVRFYKLDAKPEHNL